MRTTQLHTLQSFRLEKKDICSGTTMLITTEVLQQSNLEKIAIGKVCVSNPQNKLMISRKLNEGQEWYLRSSLKDGGQYQGSA